MTGSKLIFGFLFFFTISVLSGSANSTDSLTTMLDSTLLTEEQIALKLKIAEEKKNTDIRLALICAKQALSDAEEMNSPKWIAESKLAIGEFYDYLGVNSEALNHLQEALAIFQELNDQSKRLATLRLIGNNYYYLGQYELAKDYYEEVLEYAQMSNDTVLIIDGLINKGAVYGNTREIDSALIMFTQSFELAKSSGLLEKEIHSLFFIADVHLYSNQILKALDLFHDLVNNYDLATVNPRNYTGVLNSMTLAYFRLEDIPQALEYSRKSKEALEKYPRDIQEIRYSYNRYKIDSFRGNWEEAFKYYQIYQELTEETENENFKSQLANFEIIYNLEKKENKIEMLTLDNQLKDFKIRQRKYTNHGAMVLIVLLMVIILQAFRSYRKTKEKNQLLEEQKEELKTANEKILAQAERLQERNDELEALVIKLNTTQQQLFQAEKMASLGTLTAGVAHEINNPLNFIHGGIELIRELLEEVSAKNIKDDTKEEFSSAIKIVKEGVDRSTKIVSSLMNFSYCGEPKLSMGNITDIIDSTIKFLNSKITSDVEVIFDYGFSEESLLYADKLHQVFLNVLDNSIAAISKNRGEKQIRIETSKADKDIVIKISNNGPNIPENKLRQIFDPFFTTKNPGEGTGLGLSITYTLIQQHKGTIRAQNDEGGVSFIISIPHLS